MEKTAKQAAKERWALDLNEKLLGAGVSVGTRKWGYDVSVGCTSREEVLEVIRLVRSRAGGKWRSAAEEIGEATETD